MENRSVQRRAIQLLPLWIPPRVETMERKSHKYLGRKYAILSNIDNDFSNTFCPSPKDSELQVKHEFSSTRQPQNSEIVQDEARLSYLAVYKTIFVFFVRIANSYQEVADPYQLYYISQKRSYSRLRVTHNLLQHAFNAYTIFPSAWDFIVPFGFKTRESDIGTASCKFQQNEPLVCSDGSLGSFGSVTFLYHRLWALTFARVWLRL